ncbi:unnamed protein product [Cercopithifilaria johnstoni]|uniref:Uncharacterized protein n=1 Tax=Cercopithifilaria johnstoni TaxID=2874296 RepID=A0A8J2Q914_9BILA|nr:unnamed protein product [Cercopithifilaria johnstoni]
MTFDHHAWQNAKTERGNNGNISRNLPTITRNGTAYQGCGVRDVEYGMRSTECGIRGMEKNGFVNYKKLANGKKRDTGCRIRDAECGMRDTGCGIQGARQNR